MNIGLPPVDVDISIESLSIERDAFYNVCFITENDTAVRTLEVKTLTDLLEGGYGRTSLAYNFCIGVFAQQAMPVIYIRAKRTSETYAEAFSADNNNNYYFISIESKDLSVAISFNDYINSLDDYKLQFFSTPTNTLGNRKVVGYYQKPVSVDELVSDNTTTISNHYLNKAFDSGYDVVGIDTATTEQLQQARLAYPESAWIALCGNVFPSSVQWLYKYLAKVDVVKDKTILDLMTTTSLAMKDIATTGSGMTNQGILIHEQVSLDWVKWALSRKVWSTLYTKEKINATQGGLDLIINDIKMVLDLAVQESMFVKYQITETKLDRNTNTIQVKFTAELTHTILEVEVNGSLRY